MDAYIELLKKSYYAERKKLEEMSIFNHTGKLRFLALKKEILQKAQENLEVSQVSGRDDIPEEVKENLLHDPDKAYKIQEYWNKTIENEYAETEKEEEEELKNTQYPCDEYAQYLLQLEKVNALEAQLENNRLFSDMVYEEQRAIIEKKDQPGGEA